MASKRGQKRAKAKRAPARPKPSEPTVPLERWSIAPVNDFSFLDRIATRAEPEPEKPEE